MENLFVLFTGTNNETTSNVKVQHGLAQALPPAIMDYCSAYIEAFNNVPTNATSANVERLLFAGLFMISVIGLIFVATTIIYNKKLQAHP